MSDSETTLHAGKHLRFVIRDGWEYVTRQNVTGIVCVAAVVDECLLLVEQYREPIRSRTIELPAGLAGDDPQFEGESLAQTAIRELEEETGHTAERMVYLTEGPASSGLTSEVITFYRAEGVRQIGEGGGDDSEDITVHKVPMDDVDAFLDEKSRSGFLVDPKVYAGLYFITRNV
ncbi:NUDIX hydrolase [Stratiformator vulcanicus]|uniref:ADP-ribose pyrophosphatase n=1 Tax=Stratiformator vulcanicus TaxID=2527980 RepID=A0A517QZI6_9PLAN|nr:NUDIX hydrolase [Stratiformator vulcanicus]QDT37056.1 ADP-ribose pyrophosphatase [Stratiformator vulcanicus]